MALGVGDDFVHHVTGDKRENDDAEGHQGGAQELGTTQDGVAPQVAQHPENRLHRPGGDRPRACIL